MVTKATERAKHFLSATAMLSPSSTLTELAAINLTNIKLQDVN